MRDLYYIDEEGKDVDLPTSIHELPWQKQGLTKTASGYGTKIETNRKVEYGGHKYRVYTDIYSNSGVVYILPKGEKLYIH